MTFTIKKEGNYELFRTQDDQRIIAIDNRFYEFVGLYFTIAEGEQGELRRRDPDSIEKSESFRKGTYKLVEFSGDKHFQNIPYLFLERGDRYEEIYLPDGLPRSPRDHIRFVITDHTIAAESLDAYLRSDKAGSSSPLFTGPENDEPPIADYFDLSAGDLAARIRQMAPAELKRLEDFEERHKNRDTILNTIRSQLRE